MKYFTKYRSAPGGFPGAMTSIKQMSAMMGAMVLIVIVCYALAFRLGVRQSDWFIGIVALVVTIAAAILQFPVSSMFTPTEKKLLGSFSQVFEAALNMLDEVSQSSDLEFYMVAASPAFGLELSSEERLRWDNLFSTCVVTGKTIHLLCLSPLPNSIGRSPLQQFCLALAAHLQDAGRRHGEAAEVAALKYEGEALKQMRFYHEMSTLSPSYKTEIKVGTEPPFQIVLTRNRKTLESKGVVYFSSTKSLRDSRDMTGVETKDRVTNDILYYLYSHFSSTYATLSIQQIPVPSSPIRNDSV